MLGKCFEWIQSANILLKSTEKLWNFGQFQCVSLKIQYGMSVKLLFSLLYLRLVNDFKLLFQCYA